jgi:foldase protein PrsA
MDRKLLSIGIGAFAGTFAAVLLVCGIGGCGHRADTLAYINGQPITLAEFYQYLQNKSDVSVVTENGIASVKVDGSLGFQALRDLVSQEIELELAKDKGLYPSEAELEEELNAKRRANPSYLLDLLGQGLTLATIKQNLTVELAQEKLLTQGTTITEAQARAYVKSHASEFTQPAKADLLVILVGNAAKRDKVDDDLSSGQSFSTVALQRSEQPDARTFNGHLTNPSEELPAISSLPEEVQVAIKGLGIEQSTSWISYGGGYAKFFVNKLVPSEPTPMDDMKIDLLRRALAKQEGAKKVDLEKLVTDKLRDSKIEVVQPAYQEAWKTMAEQLKPQK